MNMPTKLDLNKIASDARADRLNAWIKEHYAGKQSDFINEFALNQGEVSALAGKRRVFGERKARILEEKTNIPSMYLEGIEEDAIRAQILAQMSGVITTEQMSDEERSQKIFIELYDVQFSCGTGDSIEFHFESIKKNLPFEPDFFTKRKIKPENFKLIYAHGDSNEEYIFDGDAVGIDISDINIRDGETYAMYFEGEALIKQIFKKAGGELVLHSRNPKYEDKSVHTGNGDSFKIMGRVRYRSG